MKKELFRINNLHGRYLDQIVLNQVSFSVYEAEILCLFGFNNSGKTTIVNILSGNISGKWEKTIFHHGNPVNLESSEDYQNSGIFCISSSSKLLSNLTVAENLLLTSEPWYRLVDYNYLPIIMRTKNLLDSFNISVSPTQKVQSLPEAKRLLVEIIFAAQSGAELVVLDCLSSFSSPEDLDTLKNVLFKLQKSGIAILYTCDKLNPDLLFSDRMIIIRNGLKVKEITAKKYNIAEISKYASDPKIESAKEKSRRTQDLQVFFEMQNVIFNTSPFSLVIFKGETIGIYNPDKNILSDFARKLHNGELRYQKVKLYGRETSNTGYYKWMKKNTCLIFDMSNNEWMFNNLSILENITIGIPRHGFIKSHVEDLIKQENKEIIEIAEEYRNNNTSSVLVSAKILIKRLQLQKISMAIFIRPEVGLDPASQHRLFTELLKLNDYGISVVLLSDDLNALAEVCSRLVEI